MLAKLPKRLHAITVETKKELVGRNFCLVDVNSVFAVYIDNLAVNSVLGFLILFLMY